MLEQLGSAAGDPRRAAAVAAASGRYAVLRLALSDFRSYAALELALDPRPVVLTGANGAGKTNLLEAVSLLTPGKGLRGADMAELPRGGGDGAWAVAATLRAGGAEIEAGTGCEPGAARRKVRLNHAPASGPQALAEAFRVLWLTPAMDRLFLESAGGRRRFLDRLALALDPAHAAHGAAYEQAARERLKLVNEGRADAQWLDALERTMAEHGAALAAGRGETVRRLNAELSARANGPFPAAHLALDGDIDRWLEDGPAAAAEDRLAVALRASRARDADAGRTLTGPQRSDLRVTHVAKSAPAARCSTGEQKALLLAIVLANARLQRRLGERLTPVLLLDEVAAHLDSVRRAALFDEIGALGAQAWMTGTDAALFAPLGASAQAFAVEAAHLTSYDLRA